MKGFCTSSGSMLHPFGLAVSQFPRSQRLLAKISGKNAFQRDSDNRKRLKYWGLATEPLAFGKQTGFIRLGIPIPIDNLSWLRPIHRSDPRKAQGQRTVRCCLFIKKSPRHPWPKDDAKPPEIKENEETNGLEIRRQRQDALGLGNRPLAANFGFGTPGCANSWWSC